MHSGRLRHCRLPLLAGLAAALLVSGMAGAGDQTADQTFVVVGSAVSTGGEGIGGSAEAIASGLAAAVGQAAEALLPEEGLQRYFRELDGLIFQEPEKFVVNYSVLSQSTTGRRHSVLLKAIVSTQKIKTELAAYGILRNEPEVPSILLLIAEQNIDDFSPKYWWNPKNRLIDSGAVPAMEKALASRGLTVLDRRELLSREQVEWQLFNKAELTFREAADLGSRLGADLVVLGNSLTVPTTAEVGAGMHALKGIVSAHLIDSRSAEEIAKISQTALGTHADEAEAGAEAIANAGRLAGEDLALKIVQARQKQTTSVARIEVIVEGTKNLVHFVQFRRALSAVIGVEKVQIQVMGADQATLMVEYKGKGEELAAALKKNTFDTFGIELIEVSAGSVRLLLVAG